jgi:SsrA-binding protein
MREKKIKPIARNKRAFYNFEILDRLEAGMALMGSEVKSLRAGHVAFGDSHARFIDDALILVSLDIPRYEEAGINNHEPKRPRKLLVRKQEMRRLESKVVERGLTIIPLSLYFLGSWAKVELGLCRGKRRYDKRDVIRRREAKREVERELKKRR